MAIANQDLETDFRSIEAFETPQPGVDSPEFLSIRFECPSLWDCT